eukprot:XP_003723878.1 PREDICTED: SUMO-specific isopeptidase USPL1 [Strongylocentrotus purpuratus]
MAEIKYNLPKAVVVKCRQRRGRRKTVAMAPASLNGPVTGLEEKEMEGEDAVEWCKECMKRGELNAVSYLQISDELAVLVCNDKQCTSLPTLAPGSHLVVERRAADFIQCRRRKRRATSLQKLDPTNPQNKLISQSQPQDPLSMTVSPLPPSGIVQWNNESSMCWLDVCMLLLVQFRSLRRCHQALGATSPLRKLCDGFVLAQEMASADVEAIKKNLSEQPKSNNSASVEQPTNASDIDLLSAYLGNDLLGAGDNPNLDHADLLSDNFVDLIDGKLPDSNVCDTSAQHVADELGDSVPPDKDRLSPNTTSSKQSPYLQDNSTGKLAAAVESLKTLRKELFEMLKPKLGCRENKEESLISALPMLLRLDGVTEEHFNLRYRRESYCFSCGCSNVTIHRNVIASVTSTSNDFSMQNLTMHHPCPQCKAPGQTSRLIYHSLPACPLIHFSNGLSSTTELPWLQPDFRHRGQQYHLSCIVQYVRNPNHFVIWIRDPSREQWLKCDGLSSPVCLWQSQEPSIPPSEIHLVGWERQNSECYSCMELQQQMVHIEEAALEREDDPAVVKANSTERTSVDCDAPLRKRSCPVVVRRSASPLTIAKGTWPSLVQAARNRSDISRLAPRRTEPLPGSSILSIGTPPQSPEFQMPKTSGPSDSNNSISSATFDRTKETDKLKGDTSKQQTLSDKLKEGGWERAVTAAKSENQGHLSNRRSVASYLQSKLKYPQKTPGVLTGLLGNYTKSIAKQQQDTGEEAITPRGIYNPITKNFSVLQTLRSLNVNSSLPKTDRVPKPDKKPGPKTKPLMETGGAVLPSVPKKVQKMRIPRQKINSFSAFKEKSSSTFSGYLKQKDPTAEDIHTNRKDDRRRESNASQIQEDDFQSSILLTPSSSVSSPSACSDVSLLSETLLAGGTEDHEVESLNNTMNALCKALDVAAGGAPQTVVSQPLPSVDDDSFLQGLLR